MFHFTYYSANIFSLCLLEFSLSLLFFQIFKQRGRFSTSGAVGEESKEMPMSLRLLANPLKALKRRQFD